MTRLFVLPSGLIFAAIAAGTPLLLGGCADEPPPPAYEPREVSEYSQPQPAPAAPRVTPPATPGHDPHATMSPHTAHPPLAAPADDEDALQLDPHPDWRVAPPRAMTVQVYALPAVEGDPEDADLAVSFLNQHIPLAMNIDRWCGQFELAEGAICEEAARERPLEGTKHPTTVVELAGAYRGGSTFAPPGPAKPGYVMLVAEVRTPDRPWYLRLVGPERTVRHWEQEFLKFTRQAE